MPRFVHPETKHVIETAIAREAAELRSQGYREEVFDPSAVGVQEVVAHLDRHAGQQREIDRVLSAEEAGKSRSTVLGWSPPEPATDDTPPAGSDGNDGA